MHFNGKKAEENKKIKHNILNKKKMFSNSLRKVVAEEVEAETMKKTHSFSKSIRLRGL